MDLKEPESKRTSVPNSVLSSGTKMLSLPMTLTSSNNLVDQMRGPFGVAAIDLTPNIKKPEDFKNTLDLSFILV